ncbi:tRNA (adenosine(37)-N6)-threonylcarbamoyltransferase complex dimerization subunit type 1 TsaB [Falsihalocynthiibacter sp. S25ZX9]|uniref:tRNA (adenosine(37)-N6)-threonylcarbamoyltransferase complex dimerization subunit type 1 TsaB n=1 Tax=Falsihalocynthiibacter sp. S25ZX9 TaxID=3240870 RepID=UPI00350FEE34
MLPDRLVLGFDTSAAHCAAALLFGDQVLAQTYVTMHKGQAENLVPILEDVLAQAGHKWADLAAIGVGTGPGNFTGIRISVALARGLAMTLGIPAVGVTALEAQADGLERPIYSLIPAPRDTYYIQSLGADVDVIEQIPLVEAQARVLEEPSVGPVDTTEFTPSNVPLAVAIAKIAARRFEFQSEGQRPTPFYVRSADAAPAKDAPPVLLD